MRNKDMRSILLVAPLVLLGCATKGYVREQVAAMEHDMNRVEQSLSQQVQDANGRVAGLEASTGRMNASIDEARRLALGDVDLTEVDRCRVYFAFDSDQIRADQKAALDRVATSLEANPRLVVNVFGFTDPTGSAAYNAELGRRRAEAVMRYLVDHTGDALRRYQMLSFGEDAPARERESLGTENERRRQALVVLLEAELAGERSDLTQQ